MDYTVHGILQVRILEWIAIPFSRGSSQPRDQTQIPGPTQTNAAQEAIPWKDTEPGDRQGWMQVHSGLCPMLGQKHPWVMKICWRRDRLPTPVFLGFFGGSRGKESACNAGDLCSIPGLGRSLEEGKGYPLQYSDLEDFMDRGAWWATVHGVTKSQT